MPLLSEHYKTVSVDHRNTGTEASRAGVGAIDEIVSSALTALDKVGSDRAHVVGISVGGFAAQEMVFTAPDRLASLTLASTSCGDPSVAVQPEPIVTNMLVNRASLPPQASIEAMVPYAYAATTPRTRIAEDMARRLRDDPTTAKQHLSQLVGASSWRLGIHRLGDVTVPTLVVHGTHDRMVPFRNAEILADAIPTARLIAIDGAGHMLCTDAPERFAQTVMGFLECVDGKTQPGSPAR